MPELPEVETTRRGLLPHLRQSSIIGVEVRNPNLRWKLPDSFSTSLLGCVIADIDRRSKYLIFHLENTSTDTRDSHQSAQIDDGSNRQYVYCHLGMSGSLRLEPCGTAPQKHDHVVLSLKSSHDTASKGALQLHYHDPRRFGFWGICDALADHGIFSNLGPEPFSDMLDLDYLFSCLTQSRRTIKSCLMDQKIVVGVGNIYANEVLFLCGIHPSTEANKLSIEQAAILCQNIKQVLSTAIEKGGTTLKDFVSPSGKPGYFSQELYVYGRAGLACKQCSSVIEKMIINQRASYFCPNCQPE